MNHSEIVSFLWDVADLTPRDVVHFMVDRLKELGTALISAAVTGKIDVPGSCLKRCEYGEEAIFICCRL